MPDEAPTHLGLSAARVTLRDIAEKAGVSHATVSMALRDSSKVATETRRLIREVADRLGYRPDPMLSALSIYREAKRAPTFHGVLGWIDNFSARGELRREPNFEHYFRGARERALHQGFDVQEFWLGDPAQREKGFSEMMRSRGVPGLLMAPQPRPHMRLDLNWSYFSVVSFGFTLENPAFHLVAGGQYRAGLLTVRKLYEKGYRRILYVSFASFEERTDHNFFAGFSAACRVLVKQDNSFALLDPVELPSTEATENQICAELRVRVTAARCDAVITHAQLMPEWLKKAGFSVPEEIAVAQLGWTESLPDISGADQKPRSVGAAAVDMLVSMIHRGERGTPQDPLRLLVEPSWREGKSTPDRSPRKTDVRAGAESVVAPNPAKAAQASPVPKAKRGVKG